MDPGAFLQENLSAAASAAAKGVAIGPCDMPFECEVCLGAMCFTTEKSNTRRRRGKSTQSILAENGSETL